MRPARPLAPAAALGFAAVLAGCLAAPAPVPAGPADGVPGTPPPEALAFTDQEATLLAVPLIGGQAEFAYEVPEGAGWVAATLRWQTRGTALTLAAADPGGQERGEHRSLAGSSPRSPARLDWWAADPAAGAWTFTVRGEAALQEPVRIQFHTARAVEGMHVAQRTEVPPGGFVEVNLEMRAGQSFAYAWTTASPVAFNIHTHRDGVTTNVVEETTDAMQATFTAEEDGGYSLMWEPAGEALAPVPGGAPVALEYRVDGQYELHSGVG